MQKNTAGQKFLVFAFNRTTLAPVTGDALNITAKLRKDHGAATALADTNPTEIESGYYEFDATAAETDANILDLIPVSVTADVQVIGVPARIFTVPASFQTLAVGNLDASVNSRLAAAGYTAPDNAGITAIKAKTDNLPADPATESFVNTRLAAASYTPPNNGGISLAASAADAAYQTALAALKIVEADWLIDSSVSPWQLVLRERGTLVELLRKDLREVDGTAITTDEQIIGQQLAP